MTYMDNKVIGSKLKIDKKNGLDLSRVWLVIIKYSFTTQRSLIVPKELYTVL